MAKLIGIETSGGLEYEEKKEEGTYHDNQTVSGQSSRTGQRVEERGVGIHLDEAGCGKSLKYKIKFQSVCSEWESALDVKIQPVVMRCLRTCCVSS